MPAPKDSKKDNEEIQRKDAEGKQLTEKDVEKSLKESYKFDIFDV